MTGRIPCSGTDRNFTEWLTGTSAGRSAAMWTFEHNDDSPRELNSHSFYSVSAIQSDIFASKLSCVVNPLLSTSCYTLLIIQSWASISALKPVTVACISG